MNRLRAAVILGAAAIGVGLMAGSCGRPVSLPWCAVWADSGTRECSFYTFEQCLASISGAGGVCVRNPRPDDGPAGRSSRARPR